MFFFFNDTATTEIYPLSLHDALPIWKTVCHAAGSHELIRFTPSHPSRSFIRSASRRAAVAARSRSASSISYRFRECRSEEHTSELQSRQYRVPPPPLKKKNIK